jgi:hypothetical protein
VKLFVIKEEDCESQGKQVVTVEIVLSVGVGVVDH